MRLSFAIAAALSLAAQAAGALQPEAIFQSARGLGPGWYDYGWSPRSVAKGEPAKVDLEGYGGWIVARPDLHGEFGALRFRYRAPASFGAFLEVALGAEGAHAGFPGVKVAPGAGRALPDGFREVVLPMTELNPSRAGFDRVVLRAYASVGSERVEFDELLLADLDGPAPEAPSRPLAARIDCGSAHAISPLIYGVGFGAPKAGLAQAAKAISASARRWGGNPASRYNWRLGNAWNTASDWFFQNVDYDAPKGPAYQAFLDEDLALGLASALTVPTIGWVAKDTRSSSFPASLFGQQQQMSPYAPVGNGISLEGKPLDPGSPARTSVPMPPDGIEKWVRAIRAHDAGGPRSVQMYILDNEPALWSSTHRDVHPEPLTYDELLERTIAYGSAVRRADPGATIAGPAEWGWTGYLYSAADAAVGFKLHPDRLRHFNKPLLPWLLGKVREHERKTGVRVLDVVDVHFYPQAKGIGIHERGDVTPEGAARRIRSTRALWDPSYRDESWIDEEIRLLPRLREWIDENAPGLGISIGEWNFGAETHMSGGLAVAEALGRFGAAGLYSAFYWTTPIQGSAAHFAFRAFRDYDGKGGRFLDQGLAASVEGDDASLFASRDDRSRKLTAVLLNFSPATAARSRIALKGCGGVTAARAFEYTGGPAGLRELPAPTVVEGGVAVRQKAAPYSITVLELQLAPAAKR